MTDVKETIQGLYALKTYLASKAIEEHGVAKESLIGMQKVVDSAVNLLKEQEPKQIVRKQGKRENSDGSIDYFGEWYCPHCGKLLNRGFDIPWIKFCYKCGGAVKWND